MKIITKHTKHIALTLLSGALLISLSSPSYAASHTKGLSVATINAQQTNNSIWRDIVSGFQIDHHASDPRVQKEIHKLLRNPKYFNRVLNNSAPYMYYIYQQTKAYGLPAELAMIPFIESEFSPNDRSYVGALGLWQLMPATARGLGVKVGRGYDGRRNVIASTQAALRYFDYLGKMFHGNWYLAIAAYNSGEGNVLRAERRDGSKDFFKLNHLPRETRLYVPKLLAVAEILSHPEKYGVTLPELKDKPFFMEINIDKPETLSKVAKDTGIQLKTLRKLNPDLKPGVIAPKQKDGEREVLVPFNESSKIKA